MGELEAHATWMKILDDDQNGKWLQAVHEAEQARTKFKQQHDMRADRYTVGFSPQDSVLIIKALGPMNTDDLASVTMQYLVDVNMMTVKQASSPKDTTEFYGRSIDMLRTLYKTYAPAQMALTQ